MAMDYGIVIFFSFEKLSLGQIPYRKRTTFIFLKIRFAFHKESITFIIFENVFLLIWKGHAISKTHQTTY